MHTPGLCVAGPIKLSTRESKDVCAFLLEWAQATPLTTASDTPLATALRAATPHALPKDALAACTPLMLELCGQPRAVSTRAMPSEATPAQQRVPSQLALLELTDVCTSAVTAAAVSQLQQAGSNEISEQLLQALEPHVLEDGSASALQAEAAAARIRCAPGLGSRDLIRASTLARSCGAMEVAHRHRVASAGICFA